MPRIAMATLNRFRGPALLAVLLTVPACRITDCELWHVPATADRVCGVRRVPGIAYRTGPGADSVRHRLDLFLPEGRENFPVVVLVHGGAWMLGDNRCCGLYSSVGEYLASQGIAAVLPNYRLSPSVQHPEHIRDVACAFAWTRANLPAHGGRADRLFVMGHSAGGHLAALLATDEQFLAAEDCCIRDIRGVACLSGVYRIPEGRIDLALGGNSPRSVRLDEMSPLRRAGTNRRPWEWDGIPLSSNLLAVAFAADRETRRAASPVEHVRPGLPPFLLISAERDLPLLPQMAEEMHQALCRCGCESQLLIAAHRNHNSMMFGCVRNDDPVARALVDFVRSHE